MVVADDVAAVGRPAVVEQVGVTAATASFHDFHQNHHNVHQHLAMTIQMEYL